VEERCRQQREERGRYGVRVIAMDREERIDVRDAIGADGWKRDLERLRRVAERVVRRDQLHPLIADEKAVGTKACLEE
jgi:hypothetical protein